MGVAGSGKGTQGQLLAKESGYTFLSTGELLRTYGSDDQHKRMLVGEILGDEEVTELVDKALSEIPQQNKMILDGYPRSVAQADWLLEQQEKMRFKLECVLHLVISRQAAKARLFDRARADDHDEAIEARFSEYDQATRPVLTHLLNTHVPVVEVNAEQLIDDVHTEIMNIIKQCA